MNLADRIHELRKENGLSQEAFAEKMGVSRQSVSKWESGSALPDTEKIIAMSELFGVSTDFLLKNDNEKEDEPFVSEEEIVDEEKTENKEIKKSKKKLIPKIIAAVLALCIVVTAVALPLYYGGIREAWWELNGGKIQYPYVLVHGLGGWGEGDGINSSVQYWGATSGDLKAFLTEEGYRVYTPSVGPMSSAWDRACELYAQLTGTQVDYGEAHSKEHNHARFGEEFDTPMFEGWGTKINGGQRVKINLVGHSFGGATVRLLVSLLEYGSEAEKAASPDNVSPLFEGGKGDWVNSVTSLCAPHNGSQLTEIINTAGGLLGVESTTDLLIDLCFSLSGLTSDSVNDVYDFKLDHFGIDEDSEDAVSQLMELGNDHAAYDLSPDGANELNKTIKTVEDVYYFSYYYSTTKEGSILSGQVPDSGTNPVLMLPAGLIGKYKGTTDGGIKIDETWQENDGLVSTISAKYPFGEEWADLPEGEDAEYERGIWYVAPERKGDHGTVIGLNADAESTNAFFVEMFSMVDSLKRY
ncbi:MAG: helix-turn-helix domain-containing protein [Clostridia bacterium]|nr:helix-turn-helix domain-containing protein [Clostridia bacterium]